MNDKVQKSHHVQSATSKPTASFATTHACKDTQVDERYAGFGWCEPNMVTEKIEKPRQNSHGRLPIHWSSSGGGMKIKRKKRKTLKEWGNFQTE